MTTAIIYLTVFLLVPESDSAHTLPDTMTMRILQTSCGITAVVLMLAFVAVEVKTLQIIGVEYFKDFWNYIDILSFAFNIMIIVHHLSHLLGIKETTEEGAASLAD